MNQKELSTLTDQELLNAAKKMKSSAIMHATLIGLMMGVIVYGVAKNNIGFFMLIPLLLLLKMFNNSDKHKKNEALKKALKERNLE